MPELAGLARANGMDIVSCAEEIDLRPYGIRPGKCIDDEVIAEAFGMHVLKTKDPAQRKRLWVCCQPRCRHVRVVPVRLSVLLRHQEFDKAAVNFDQHDPNSPSLLGWHEPPKGAES